MNPGDRVRHVALGLLMSLVMCAGVLAPVTANPSVLAVTPAAEIAVSSLVADTTVQIDFPTGLSVASSLSWSGVANVARLELLYSSGGSETATIAYTHNGVAEGTFQTRVETTVNLQRHFLPVGIELSLWWRLVGSSGMTLAESNPFSAMWFDTGHDWTERTTEQVYLYSYAMSEDFADHTLAVLQDTVDQLASRFEMEMHLPLRVWVYETYSDFQAAQPPNSRESVAALAFTGYQTIAAIVSDGNESELLRVLPHEVSHQVLHQATANAFSYAPVWFDEGMATHVQTGGTDGYMDMVVRAAGNDELFRLDSLNAGFPFSPAQATLAYATSWSAFAYIEGRWGDEGIGLFIDAIAEGMPYAEATNAAFGISAGQLNDDWTAWVAAQ